MNSKSSLLRNRLRVGYYTIDIHCREFLFISGYPDEEMQRLGLATGGHELLRKPFSPDALRDGVRRLLKLPTT